MTMTAIKGSYAEAQGEPADVQQGDVVMPFYVVFDISTSMKPLTIELNEAGQGLQQDILDHPEVSDIVRVGMLTFHSTADVLVPLGALETADIPRMVPDGGTNYSNAFIKLRSTIDADIAALKAQGLRTFRPCVFFLSDGDPNPSDSDWEGEFARQFGYSAETGQGNKHYPRVIPFGFGDASMETMAKIAYPSKDGVAFVQKNGASVRDAFAAILPLVGRTILASGRTAVAGAAGPSHAIQTSIPGFDAVPSQYAGGDWM